MRQKSNSPGVVRDACAHQPAGKPGSTARPKRRSALCSMACAARPQSRRALPARRHRREHVLLLAGKRRLDTAWALLPWAYPTAQPLKDAA